LCPPSLALESRKCSEGFLLLQFFVDMGRWVGVFLIPLLNQVVADGSGVSLGCARILYFLFFLMRAGAARSTRAHPTTPFLIFSFPT